ncbi:MAG: hypothetical protein AABY93_03465 [Bacteroidota bacterium]
MKKRTIVIASVLKPVDDTRMFEKFGISLSESGNYKIVIIGYPSRAKPAYPNIDFIALKPFRRLSLKRLVAPIKVLLILSKVKHDILIINTHELVIVAILNRILFGGKILYDIQENYYRNILHTDAFPILIRPFVALLVRAKEMVSAPFFHWFLLAEKGYTKEFSFPGKKFTILENKPRVPVPFTRVKKQEKTQLLFSGTLGESTGIFQAIALTKSLHHLDSTITLRIIGYAARYETYLRIQEVIRGCDFITLAGGDYLVPHSEVMTAILEADFGIVFYPLSPHTQSSMPTKLYEYVATRLPILLQDHKAWVEFCSPYPAAIVLTKTLSPAELLFKMQSEHFYSIIPSNVSWISEEAKLIDLLIKI